MRGKSILKRSVLGVAVLMVFAMVLVSCTQSGGNTGAGDSATPATGGEATETSTDDGTGGEKAYTLGFSNWGKGVYPLDVLELETQNFTDLNGLKLLPASNDFKADKIVSDVQSLISSQVDGIAIMCAVETTIPTVANLMNEAGTPFVFFDKLPSDLAVLDKIVAEDPAFVGACAPTNYEGGYMMGEQAAADGNKTAIICASNKGDSSQDDRIKGFTESFESAGGKVLGVSHSNDPSEAVSKASDLITANMDADCLYGSGGDFLNGAVNALENFPDLDIMVYGTDITPDFIELVANGKIDGLNGGHFVECSIATALLVNYLDGHPILDENGKPPVFTNLKWVTVTPETVSNYQEYWIDGHPFTDDAYKNMLWRNNPEVNYQYFYDLCENYSMESIIASRQ